MIKEFPQAISSLQESVGEAAASAKDDEGFRRTILSYDRAVIARESRRRVFVS